MPTSIYLLLLLAVGAQRLAELLLSRRNLARARARGAEVVPERVFPWIVAMHALFLPAIVGEIFLFGSRPSGYGPALAGIAFACAQILKLWAIRSLGPRWNVRIVILPGAPLVRQGPYRWLRHPNYLAVALEFLTLPWLHGAWRTALAFSLANAALLAIRIRGEERALARASPSHGAPPKPFPLAAFAPDREAE